MADRDEPTYSNQIHTDENTNTEFIEQNYQSLPTDNTNENCVLIITGSLNPIHRSHIKNLQHVKDYLENHISPPLNVLGAYLSPTHDSYVGNKLGRLDLISATDRCNLCEEAIKHEKKESWIAVAKGECQANTFYDFDEISIDLAQFLNTKLYKKKGLLKKPLKVVYVCGLDHFNKCPHVARLAKEDNLACAIIYRTGAYDDDIKTLDPNSSNIYYIRLDNEHENLINISSTAIRERCRNSKNIDDDDSTYPFVWDFLRNKYRKN